MNMYSIYENPEIDNPCFLFVQLQQVVEQPHKERIVSILEFRVEPLTPDFGGKYLYSNLHQTQQAEKMWTPCRETFRFDAYDVQSAINRWGKILLVGSRWQSVEYSTVQYIQQTAVDMRKVIELEQPRDRTAIERQAAKASEAAKAIREAIKRNSLDDVIPLY